MKQINNDSGQTSTEYSIMILVVMSMVLVAATCSRLDKDENGNDVHTMRCVGKTCDNLKGIGYEER